MSKGKFRKKPVVVDAEQFNPESFPWPDHELWLYRDVRGQSSCEGW